MSTMTRNRAVTPFGEPISSPSSRNAVARSLLHWAAIHSGLTSIGLVLVYVGTVAALVAVLSASALATPVGAVVGAVFVVELLVYFAIAIYIFMPERSL